MLEFSGEGDKEEIVVVVNQAPPGLGLARTPGLWEDSEEGFSCKPFPWIM